MPLPEYRTDPITRITCTTCAAQGDTTYHIGTPNENHEWRARHDQDHLNDDAATQAAAEE